ncbi:MAG TPA: diguanylate cyclase [Pseudobacteroides sp.]|uniref:diguanylate cyclase n=1 Tax=Pseudobacteroides sp. TaxID=1968840 RepID=UPI002F93B77C
MVYEKSISNYELTHKDKLTGLGNRIMLEENLMRIMKHETVVISNLKYAVIFIDLDGVKEVNDEYGHEPSTDCFLLPFLQEWKGCIYNKIY